MNFTLEEISSPFLYSDTSFCRQEESSDSFFYSKPRFIQHLDSCALSILETLIAELIIEKQQKVLDLMASWDSHIPIDLDAEVTGLGLNSEELEKNSAINKFVLHDLNENPELPFESESFDVVLNTLSVGYLTHPFEVFNQVGRILKPGGLFLVAFSNRLFSPKAVEVWSQATDQERFSLIEDYFNRTNCFEPRLGFACLGRPRLASDKYAPLGLPSDPVFAVYADKKGGPGLERPLPEKAGALPEIPGLDEIREKKLLVRENHCCPYCETRLQRVGMEYNPFSEWDTDYVLVCLNDLCPYLVRGWETMFKQGNSGLSYRFLFHPYWKQCLSVPVYDLNALKDSIISE